MKRAKSEEKSMLMERGERKAHDDGKGDEARVNGRQRTANEPASTKRAKTSP